MKFEFKIKIPKNIIFNLQLAVNFDLTKIKYVYANIDGNIIINRQGIHELIQTHAFTLGYEWREKNDQDHRGNPRTIQHWDKPALHLGGDGRIKYYAREKDFKACDAANINWKEFLKLKGE